jgi:hypothetical protein
MSGGHETPGLHGAHRWYRTSLLGVSNRCFHLISLVRDVRVCCHDRTAMCGFVVGADLVGRGGYDPAILAL